MVQQHRVGVKAADDNAKEVSVLWSLVYRWAVDGLGKNGVSAASNARAQWGQ